MEFFWNIFPNKIVQGSFSTAAGKKVDQQDKRKKDTQETKKQASDSCTQIMWTCLSEKKKNKSKNQHHAFRKQNLTSCSTMIACSGGPDKGGAGHPGPEIRGGQSQKNFFLPFGPQFGLKIGGGQSGIWSMSTDWSL